MVLVGTLKHNRSVAEPAQREPRAREPVEAVDRDEPESLLARRELATTLGRALLAISPEQRAVVELTYYYGLSYQEISDVVGCPVNTVKTRMFHARRRLKDLLPEMGISSHVG